ncbi:RRM_1 domain-containing protein [Cephalotus follicularis]|uniref:RRM_1 domain-containing protein n=1 Tax=Cephalotus follicularis TaxID=3775 RepID=A0A1Q3D1G3_CEPFO|nr:RRM_1 domain-containing protein [Cephalotus follicularis]
MIALRGSLMRYLNGSNPKISTSQLAIYRGISSTLFVKGISFSTTEEGLAGAFSQFGHVLEAKIITDKEHKRSKGYGYVTFTTDDEAQTALMDMNGKLLDGRVVFVDKARPRPVPKATEPPKIAADN